MPTFNMEYDIYGDQWQLNPPFDLLLVDGLAFSSNKKSSSLSFQKYDLDNNLVSVFMKIAISFVRIVNTCTILMTDALQTRNGIVTYQVLVNAIFLYFFILWHIAQESRGLFIMYCSYFFASLFLPFDSFPLFLSFILFFPFPKNTHLSPAFDQLLSFVLWCSVIQFCSTAFAYYAQATAAQEIFGHTLQSLRGIKYLYQLASIPYLYSI